MGARSCFAPLDSSQFDAIAELVGDTPFTATPYFLLRRRACDVYVDAAPQPRCAIVVPHGPHPDIVVAGAASLAPPEREELADFLAGMQSARSFLVPVELVQPIRARRQISIEMEGLCFTYRHPPSDFVVWRPGSDRQLIAADEAMVADLPHDATFLHTNYGTPVALLAEGLAFGVLRRGRLVSIAASLALTPKHCDVGVYTCPRYRSRGYATDCVESIFAHALASGQRPLWRIGGSQKVAIYFAEKLNLDEIGTDGREIYLGV